MLAEPAASPLETIATAHLHTRTIQKKVPEKLLRRLLLCAGIPAIMPKIRALLCGSPSSMSASLIRIQV
jgi:hypothetical protein